MTVNGEMEEMDGTVFPGLPLPPDVPMLPPPQPTSQVVKKAAVRRSRYLRIKAPEF